MFKKLLIGAAAGAIMFGSLAVSAFAAVPNWNITAPNSIVFSCGGGTYPHTLNTVSENLSTGDFSGKGTYDTDLSYTWDMTGNTTGNSITFQIVYTGASPGSIYNGVGTIASDGSISGTADSNCQTFSMPAGTATAIPAAITCPEGTTQSSAPLETVTVPANKDTNTNSLYPLISGTNYIFKARGTADAGDGIQFDARYSYRTQTSTVWTDAVSTYEGYGVTLLDLLYNNTTPWGAYDASHVYEASVSGTGTVAPFRINDIYYPNNTGNLYVDIYSCSQTPTDKDQCKKNGWKKLVDTNGNPFKNQGQCVSYIQANEHAGKQN